MSGPPPPVDWSAWWERPGRSGVLTDFDGTLSAIVEDPSRAVALPGVSAVLASLATSLGMVAVVSGRPVAYLGDRLPGLPTVALFGLYGLESLRDGRLEVAPAALAWQEAVSSTARRAAAEVPAGVEVERKGLAVALHFRRRPELAGLVAAWAAEAAAGTGLLAQPGRFSVGLLPPLRADKGAVVEDAAAGLDAVCFIGDDTGDLPAFAALAKARREGKTTLAIGASSAEQPQALAGAVDVMVEGPEGALAVLRELADGLAGGRGGRSAGAPA